MSPWFYSAKLRFAHYQGLLSLHYLCPHCSEQNSNEATPGKERKNTQQHLLCNKRKQDGSDSTFEGKKEREEGGKRMKERRSQSEMRGQGRRGDKDMKRAKGKDATEEKRGI